MTIEDAWLAWMKATRKTTSPPTVEEWVGHGPCPNGDFVEVKDE